jgi:hypothetical protein
MTKQRMVAVVFAAALVVGSTSMAAHGEAPPAEEREAAPASYDDQIDAFFARLAAGEHAEAVDGLYAASPLAPDLAGQLGELKDQLAEIAAVLGEYLGPERIVLQPLGERFVYAWHVAHFEKRPIQVHFSFYKPRDRWFVFQLAYDQALATTARELAMQRLAKAEPE